MTHCTNLLSLTYPGTLLCKTHVPLKEIDGKLGERRSVINSLTAYSKLYNDVLLTDLKMRFGVLSLLMECIHKGKKTQHGQDL